MAGRPTFYNNGRYSVRGSYGEGMAVSEQVYYAGGTQSGGSRHYASIPSPTAGSSASGSSGGYGQYRSAHDVVSQERQTHRRSAGDVRYRYEGDHTDQSQNDERRRSDPPAAFAGAPTPPDRKVSCLECRQSKVKCSGQPVDGDGACDRCKRMRRACVFAQHRRGRKPAKIKMHKLEQSVDTIMNAISALKEFKQSHDGAFGRHDNDDDDNDDDDDTLARPTRKRVAPSTDEGGSDTRRKVIDAPPVTMPRHSALQTGRVEVLSAELGQPPLSNPLKLLAQASDSKLDPARVDSEEAAIAATPADDEAEMATTFDEEDATTMQQRPSTKPPKERSGASRRGYWRIDMYSSRLDVGAAFDPITLDVVSLAEAEELYGLYMRHLNETITLLDPILHTFDYTRAHSSLLLSAACALAARFAAHMPNAEAIADKLDKHIQETLLPTILLKGYRSAEIAEALIILAAYHCNTQSIDGDRSWSLVGFAIRIAAELDMNARLHSDAESWQRAPKANVTHSSSPTSSTISKEERTQRILRNRERTWCNLWLYEYSLSTHMGRRSTLSVDPVIVGVGAGSGWHTSPYAIPGDEAIVALIGLRRLQIKNIDFFEHSVSCIGGGDRSTLRFQLDFYRNTCRADINDWLATYVDRGVAYGDQSFRMKNARLYASYACLILNSFALKCTSDQRLLRPFYEDSYGAAMTYLTLYAERIRAAPNGLTYVHNSSVVTAAYVSVFALKLCALADGDDDDDAGTYAYIDSGAVSAHVRALTKELANAGSVTAWRNGAASSYAPYLTAVLERVEQRRGQQANDGDGPVRSTASSPSNAGVQHATGWAQESGISDLPSESVVAETGAAAVPSEALHFIAGPSGVQAATVLEAYSLAADDFLFFGGGEGDGESTSAAAAAAAALPPLDFQFLEGSSLFRDMSMLFSTPALSASTPHHASSVS